MSRLNFLLCLAAILGLPVTLGGCAGALLVGALTGAAGGVMPPLKNAALTVRFPIWISKRMLNPALALSAPG